MPPIKLIHVVSYTSEDAKYKAENLLSGGKWLSNPLEQSGAIKVELQMEKATSINFIDIGNHNTAMLSIEVGMSSWSLSQQYVSLLPTVVFMNPIDCRSGKNQNGVRMFKKDSFDQMNASKKWDRVRITCSQPFKKNCQFGLAFLRFFSEEEEAENRKVAETHIGMPDSHSFKLHSLLPQKSPMRQPTPNQGLSAFADLTTRGKPTTWSEKMVNARRPVMKESDARKAKDQLERQALGFLISLNLTATDIRSLKVSQVREQFETNRGQKLTPREKSIFKHISLDYASERLRKFENNGDEIVLLSDDEEEIGDNQKSNSPEHFLLQLQNQTPTFCKSDQPSSNKFTPKVIKQSPFTFRKITSLNKSNESPLANCNGNASPSSVSEFNKKRRRSLEIQDENPPVISDQNLTKKRNTDQTHDAQVQCPMCSELFSSQVIEEHAADCTGSSNERQYEEPNEVMESCPICSKFFEATELKSHAEECANVYFS